MTLVDRYLRAVRDHLPRAQQDDIINELSDNLQSRIEDEAAARGRPLSEDEEAAILKEFGHPMAVAARYRGDERSVTFGRRLIGPELFPTYMKVLATNVAITLIFVAIALVAGADALGGHLLASWCRSLSSSPIVTAIFVFIDRRWISDPDGWDPRTVTSIGPDVDVSSLDGIADQLIGKAHPRAVADHDLDPGDRPARGRPDRWLMIGVPATNRVHGARPGWARRLRPGHGRARGRRS